MISARTINIIIAVFLYTGIEHFIIYKLVSHAEYKAIIGIPPSVRGCTLYVTQYPCNVCAKVIVQAGIVEVVYENEGEKDEKYISSRSTLEKCLGSFNIHCKVNYLYLDTV